MPREDDLVTLIFDIHVVFSEGDLHVAITENWDSDVGRSITIEEVEQECKDAIAALSEKAFWNNDYPGIDVPIAVDVDDSATASLTSWEEDEKTVAAIVEKHQKYDFERLVAECGGEKDS